MWTTGAWVAHRSVVRARTNTTSIVTNDRAVRDILSQVIPFSLYHGWMKCLLN